MLRNYLKDPAVFYLFHIKISDLERESARLRESSRNFPKWRESVAREGGGQQPVEGIAPAAVRIILIE